MEPTAELRQAVRKYREGKGEAFNQIYEESSKYIYTCIYKVMSGNDNVQDAVCDIMQDTYVEISKNIAQLDNENRFLSWAGTIATRKCYAWLKKNKKYVLLHEEDDTFENLTDNDSIIPEDIMQDREKQRLVREIIDTQLTEMQKLCIIAFYYNEQKQSEIAQELGIPENTVKTNLSRARAKIKENVLALEKKQGTKLYSAAPLLLLLFKEDVLACTVPTGVTESVLASGSSATGIGRIIRKLTKASVKTKMMASILAVGIIGGTVLLWNGKQERDDAVSEQVRQLQGNETVQNADAIDMGSSQDTAESNDFESGGLQEEISWQSIYTEYLLGLDHSVYEGFELHDLDADGVPEILLKSTEENHTIEIYYFHYFTKEVKPFPSYRYGLGPAVGYGSTPTEFIYISDKDDYYQPYNPGDGLAYRMVDFEIVEMVRVITDSFGEGVSAEIEANNSITELTYEQGLQRVEELEAIYQPIDYKPLDEQTIADAMSIYL
ncbi:RNA polymerase sigma factor [Acetatifactor muris]|uniref:RNA polymerase sigma factor n=1 Tax=Acetatifactor muris TaxID=879566 RepID=UPI0023F4F643|nr:sigma-70 family RNA polymerase sigma factor [Acetatifactor muris]MCI8801238.1 sigma-70 family RNA polymerase sigma factor [Lachnospiraceae bacterium]